jgi:hypothetical protein
MVTQLSLRQLWMNYKELAAPVIATRYKCLIARHSFYAGAESALAVLDQMLQDCDYEGLHKTIRRHARRIKAIQNGVLRGRRH